MNAGAIARARVHATVSLQRKRLAALIAQARRLDGAVAEYLVEHPSARIAHHQNSLLAALQREIVELDARARREEERALARAANAHDRALRNWEPHEVRAATKMGFADPADWRRYIDEREAAVLNVGSEFPSPEEWRRGRGL